MDFLGIILWPIRWVIEMILVGWHSLLTFLGMQVDGGLTWVLSIAGVVVVVRAVLIPLFVKQIKSQRKMMEIAPEMKKVQEKYRGKRDQLSREAMSRETMALYKKHGTSPVSSCLPLLVQMPVFLSLYYTLLDVKAHANEGIGGVGLLSADLTQQFNNAKLFDIAPLSETLRDAFVTRPDGWVGTTVILVIMVALMIGTQFFTQLQIVSKNMSAEAKSGQAYQMQRIMLYIIPFAMIFSGVFFPLGVVSYWFFNNLWTMCQQFLVIRELPTPGSEAAKAREERLARKGKALNSQGKVVTIAEYEAEQQELLRRAEEARAKQPKRQQPMSAKRAKKQQRPVGDDGSAS
ncbi:membrane protein insertase YidC [Microbacterium oryzae]|uniref:Membrane protein insertase YidC n=1 Tax=Microbacterium oryzae TaxID=743009 RepID=A0A6I6E8Y1_9MICO|nr:membrane protein insertase YidC [Microbacterium oryzae]QGU28061.1 membrane protein insertase YidC [Microbacterium oryzae]